MFSSSKKKKSNAGVTSSRSKKICPLVFIFLAFLLMILPLDGFVASVKAVLAYVFIPQVRLAHGTVKYAGDVHQTVQELLDAHHENTVLKERMQLAQSLHEQAQSVFTENERLSAALKLKPAPRLSGVWSKIAYRSPSQWSSVILDKGSGDGIEPRSAVLALVDGKEALAGVVMEVTENSSKVLLLQDEDFSAAVSIPARNEQGLLRGGGTDLPAIRYISLQAEVAPEDLVYTSSVSSIFPAGIWVGAVSQVRREEDFQTSLTVEIKPAVQSGAVREVFVITRPQGGKQ